VARWLNYHHLQYFWTVARRGSVAAAARELRLAPQTLSTQIHQLEAALGLELLVRRGRGLVLTDVGRTTLRYAEEIFALGAGLLDRLEGREPEPPRTLTIGIDDAVPRGLVYRMLAPALEQVPPIRIIGRDDRPAAGFLADLAEQTVELVLADAPAPTTSAVRVWSHALGECGTVLLAAPALARRLRGRAPGRLRGAPFLLPGARSAVRGSLDRWLASHELRPQVVAELDDLALIDALGARGLGVFAAPTVLAAELCRRHRVVAVGQLPRVRQRFYALSIERTIRHPAIAAICSAARRDVFGR
jgi:LysR family transcriptional activator of nhaA